MAGHVFNSKMATSFLPGHGELLNIFNGSGSEDKFEGFDLEDQDESVILPQFDSLLIENWIEGDHEPTTLPFTSTPSLTTAATL